MRNTRTRFAALVPGPRRRGGTRGFTLVELLTVMAIISLLIGILVPSLNAARNSAKKTATKAAFSSLGTALDLFRTDNEREFSRTNGYPPSFAHPRMVGAGGDPLFDPYLGEFPFLEDNPVVTGAHWLPAMLMGMDQQGYLKRSAVPKKDNLRYEPWRWYTVDPLKTGQPLERTAFYADADSLKTIRTADLPGRPNDDLFDVGEMGSLPVIVDAFGQPILYYVANANGKTTNMVEETRDENNEYDGSAGQQDLGPPFYFHQDNAMFTGTKDEPGWDFDGAHPIADPGAELNARDLTDRDKPENRRTFAGFIIVRTQLRALDAQAQPQGDDDDVDIVPIKETAPLRPSNADSYLLISAGADGRYGTSDDVTNFPLSVE